MDLTLDACKSVCEEFFGLVRYDPYDGPDGKTLEIAAIPSEHGGIDDANVILKRYLNRFGDESCHGVFQYTLEAQQYTMNYKTFVFYSLADLERGLQNLFQNLGVTPYNDGSFRGLSKRIRDDNVSGDERSSQRICYSADY